MESFPTNFDVLLSEMCVVKTVHGLGETWIGTKEAVYALR